MKLIVPLLKIVLILWLVKILLVTLGRILILASHLLVPLLVVIAAVYIARKWLS